MGFGLRNRTSLPTNMSGVVIPEGSSSHISITVKSICAGDEVFFRMKRNSPLSKLINAYCELKRIQIVPSPFNTICFVYDGAQIKPEDTPNQLGMATEETTKCEEDSRNGPLGVSTKTCI
ncbi:hypothetical protein C5167_004532 [Papaver somniferum]|uniref:Rad60/SUMO-like domain-containing protein n=1 Tax=Papaver somniferum TaxID=3469 RepID=A0A4Y7J7V8_PAPSO|nr:small ubiquitin-related modifier 1-like [Papaver somniferum]RZC57233.1 hypothetical protein C5167_004532 [Papaver somniferum]